MRLKTQLAIQAHIEGLPPRAWSRKDFQELLAEKRGDWNAPQYLTSGRLITFLLDNDFARRIDIKSKDYGAKSRYITGSLSLSLSLTSLVCLLFLQAFIHLSCHCASCSWASAGGHGLRESRADSQEDSISAQSNRH